MYFCVSGDIHGALERMYADIQIFEGQLGVAFDYVLQVGDFGIWPDANRVDRATLKHEGAGDFPTWFAEKKVAPRRTYLIRGNHEDFHWLDAQNPRNPILPGLAHIRNGEVVELKSDEGTIRVGGVGGCYSDATYPRESKGPRRSPKHYTHDECEKLDRKSRLDILLTHDAPKGTEFVKRSRQGGVHRYFSEAEGLSELVERTQPRVCFFGHHHHRLTVDVAGVPCHGLNLVGRSGYLVAIKIDPVGVGWEMLGEWAP